MATYLPRDGKKERWLMLNGNELWITCDQLAIINMVYDFLEENTTSKKKRFTTSEIAVGVGKRSDSVSNALLRLAFKQNPFVRIFADRYPNKSGGVLTVQKYELIRHVE